MKKTTALLMTLLLMLSLAACGTNGQPSAGTPESTPSDPQGVEDAQTPAGSGAQGEPEQAPEANAGRPTEKGGGKMLVAYFSWSGNTRTVAEAIQAHLDTDIFEIATVDGYSEDYDTVLDEARAEQRENARPELNAQVEDMEQYDVVFLGFPNWWGDMPMAIYTFLDTYDLSGKTVIPFVTSGGSGFSRTREALAGAEPDATFLEGLSLPGSGVDSAGDEIIAWLDGLDLSE